MFLPVILLRDFGPWSFLVFALPNCIGAALMGWILRRPGASETLVSAHRRACVWFSRITVAFHAFFLMWMVQRAGLAAPVIAGFLINLLAAALTTWRHWPGWAPAALTYFTSVACAVALALTGSLAGSHAATVTAQPILPLTDLLWLAPVCCFGFLFCPYLDLTFHLARRLLPEPAGTRAFIAGFGGFFLTMIVLTLAYAGVFLRSDPTIGLDPVSTAGAITAAFGPAAASALLIHLSTQAAFTMHLHLGMISQAKSHAAWHVDPVSGVVALLAMILGIAVPSLPPINHFYPFPAHMATGEAIYRTFMSFYGLVFPAYVWICVLPAWSLRPSRQQIRAFAAAIGVAAPMFYMGFIERQTWWLGPGLAVVLAARLFAGSPRADQPRPATRRGL